MFFTTLPIVMFSTESTFSPRTAGVDVLRSTVTSRPIIMRTRSSRVAPMAGTVATWRPSRSTVMRSANSSASSSAWDMKMIPAPRSRSVLSRWNKCCISSGVRDAVGSSKMKIFALCRTARTISTIWRLAVPRFSTSCNASTLKLRDCNDCVAAMLILL